MPLHKLKNFCPGPHGQCLQSQLAHQRVLGCIPSQGHVTQLRVGSIPRPGGAEYRRPLINVSLTPPYSLNINGKNIFRQGLTKKQQKVKLLK